MGQTKTYDPLPYDMNLPKADWPGPTPIAARAVDRGPSVNAACPYSGKPVTHFLECGGKVYGFCNAFCRDKTLADPAAWPQFMALLD
jgi:glutathione S-transferase